MWNGALEAVLDAGLEAVGFALGAVLVFARAVEDFPANAHAFDRQPDEGGGGVLGFLVRVVRQGVGQVGVGLAVGEDGDPLLGEPVFIGDEPASRCGGIIVERGETLARREHGFDAFADGGAEAIQVEVFAIAAEGFFHD